MSETPTREERPAISDGAALTMATLLALSIVLTLLDENFGAPVDENEPTPAWPSSHYASPPLHHWTNAQHIVQSPTERRPSDEQIPAAVFRGL